ncbi:Glyoxalase/bleomycin resistance protein/dioxygenase [Desulfovibrio sp. X2]|uniref:VOC family protein n=1 Tax=Desulfovibrio sp. X2 TaxID=941449 RepID=UPI0003588F14|nr:VOC family protein [Desulfovibrio sp. X2]EPR40242.1 Glyoxalase/bleomycin resistance protein/dioxygenase [Desulfovibrio sp. X2]
MTPQVRYTGVNHLAMVTGDMEATIRFWRDLLGMRLVVGLGRPGYRHYFFEISEHDMIAFFEWEGAEPIPEKDHGAPVKGPVAFDHVSFGLAGEDDLWALKDRLDAADVWVSEVVDHGFIHSIYAFDPNGIAVEFSAPVPSVDVRRYPVMADDHPSPAAMEGNGPQPGHWPGPGEPTPEEDRRAYPGDGQQIVGIITDSHTPV